MRRSHHLGVVKEIIHNNFSEQKEKKVKGKGRKERWWFSFLLCSAAQYKICIHKRKLVRMRKVSDKHFHKYWRRNIQKKLQLYDNDDDGEKGTRKKFLGTCMIKATWAFLVKICSIFSWKYLFFFICTNTTESNDKRTHRKVGWKIKIAKMGSDRVLWQAGAVYRKILCKIWKKFFVSKLTRMLSICYFSPLPEIFFLSQNL